MFAKFIFTITPAAAADINGIRFKIVIAKTGSADQFAITGIGLQRTREQNRLDIEFHIPLLAFNTIMLKPEFR